MSHDYWPTDWKCYKIINSSCTKLFGTHTFYEGAGALSRPPYDLENSRFYNFQLWQTIRTIYER